MNKFIVLRDAYGLTQVVVPPELSELIKNINHESVLHVEGIVKSRGKDINKDMETGEIEVMADEVTVINTAPISMPINAKTDSQERTKLAHRYLDLRSEKMQKNLRHVII